MTGPLDVRTFGPRSRYRVEVMPNGLTRVDDRASGLVACGLTHTLSHHSGPRGVWRAYLRTLPLDY